MWSLTTTLAATSKPAALAAALQVAVVAVLTDELIPSLEVMSREDKVLVITRDEDKVLVITRDEIMSVGLATFRRECCVRSI